MAFYWNRMARAANCNNIAVFMALPKLRLIAETRKGKIDAAAIKESFRH